MKFEIGDRIIFRRYLGGEKIMELISMIDGIYHDTSQNNYYYFLKHIYVVKSPFFLLNYLEEYPNSEKTFSFECGYVDEYSELDMQYYRDKQLNKLGIH